MKIIRIKKWVIAFSLTILFASCEKPAPPKNIGIQLVSVKDDMTKDPVATIEALGEMGYSYLETYVYSEGKFYDMEPKEFKTLVEKNGMRFEGSMTFKSLPDSSSWDPVMAWWETCIDDHLDAGVKYLTTSNTSTKSIGTLEELKKYCDYYNAVGRACKAKGVQFAYHNHANEFDTIQGKVVYDFLLENTDPSLVAFQSDLYWMHEGGVDPVDYFKRYPGRFFSWHVKDQEELGVSGEMDFSKVYAHAETAGLKYNVAEVEVYNYAPLVSVKMAYDYLFNADFVKKYE